MMKNEPNYEENVSQDENMMHFLITAHHSICTVQFVLRNLSYIYECTKNTYIYLIKGKT